MFQNSIVYQIMFRNFNSEGTIKSAEKLLPFIKELGTDIVYITPIWEADDDENREFWSPRQIKSGLNNPKNPYRIKDYYSVDSEYGSMEDLKNFTDTAHSLGMRVIFDIVYFHCSPKSVMMDMKKEYIVRDENETPMTGRWCFPMLNFDSDALREYLYGNMQYYIKEIGADGFRCDASDSIPPDFWEEAINRVRKIKPEAFFLHEGESEGYMDKGFDANYGFAWMETMHAVFAGLKTTNDLYEAWKKTFDANPKGTLVTRSLDTHDVATDGIPISQDTEERKSVQEVFGPDGVDAALVMNYTIDGIPFLYNGYEIANTSPHSMYSNRFYGKMCTDWSKLQTKEGQERLELVKNLAKLKHSENALAFGETIWNTQNDGIVSFIRKYNNEEIHVIVNLTGADFEMTLSNSETILLSNKSFTSGNNITISHKGYVVTKNTIWDI